MREKVDLHSNSYGRSYPRKVWSSCPCKDEQATATTVSVPPGFFRQFVGSSVEQGDSHSRSECSEEGRHKPYLLRIRKAHLLDTGAHIKRQI
jgi:hypothetical protein